MARGWESKSVEMQIEEASSEAGPEVTVLPSEESEMRRKRADLLLQRSRILQEIDSARKPRYRSLLEQKLAHIDNELLALAEAPIVNRQS